ncbi:MAG: inosine monophosphate cyclohydrolase [Clostridia bacterium]|jgi:hypothetical protein|nr:inosine monophosphate cyclohydrolase [Clostridia bacterium]
MENEILELGEYLRGYEYPGRGIVVGMSKDGKSAMFAYFIMGRSENSRNRIFKRDGKGIRTEVFDASKVTDPSLIIYNAVRVLGNKTIITNGDQTDTIYDFLEAGKTFEQALDTRTFEPDEPNFTPRISALIDLENGFKYKMSILRCTDGKGAECEREYFDITPEPGIAHIIHTYDGNGNPLPSFSGGPRRVKLGDIGVHAFSKTLWFNLNEENRISLFLRNTIIETGETESRAFNENF